MIKRYLVLLLLAFCRLFSIAQTKQQANNPVYQVIADSSGIHTLPFKFSPTQLATNNNWRGQWIWLSKSIFPKYQKTSTLWLPDASAGNTMYQALFRGKLNINNTPSSALLYISGDVLYNVFVNGYFAGRGPVNIGSDYADEKKPEYWYYSVFDVRPYLKKGKNIIAVKVFSTAFEISATTSSFGRFICDLSLNHQQAILSSNNTWKGNVDTSFNNRGGMMFFDAGKEPDGWQTLSYDDSAWPTASISAAADAKNFYNSEVPVPISLPVKPKAFFRVHGSDVDSVKGGDFYKTHKGHKEFILDFGKNMPAFISFSVTANKGDSILVFPFEKLNYTSNRGFTYVCRQGTNTFQTPNLSVFRYLKISLRTKDKISIKSFYAYFSSYPVQYAGSFSCSDGFYNQLWKVSRWSTQICMNDMLFDSPLHQEPIGCTGDYFIQLLNNCYAFGDAWLFRQNLIQTARMLQKNDYRMFHTSYSLIWIQMLLKYYEYTGDKELVKQLLPHAQKLLNRFTTYRDTTYLLSNAPNYMFMDWIKIGEFSAHHPPAVIGMGYLSMFYYKALKDAAVLEQLADNATLRESYDMQAAKVKKAVNTLLWVKDKRLYKDGIPFINKAKLGDWLPKDKAIVTYSAHVNTLAVLYDIAPQSESTQLMKYVVTQKEYQLQPYFMSYVLAAFRHSQQIDEGLKQVDLWKNAVDTVTYTLKENWNDRTNDGYTGDFSHGWGASPLLYLSQNILGIAPAVPGYKIIAINPYTGEKIKWARGKVPLGKHASVTVNWKASSDICNYQIRIPLGYKAALYHPVKFHDRHITVNGKALLYSSMPVTLKSGSYLVKYYR
jgi:alpha-L-rhamnosidase